MIRLKLNSVNGRQRQTKERLKQMLTIASPLFLLLLWEFLSRTGIIDIRFFPPPSAIVGTFFEMISSGEMVNHIGISLYRIFAGFLLGVIPGVVIGLTNGTLFANPTFCLADCDGINANTDVCFPANYYYLIWNRGLFESSDNCRKCLFSCCH